MTGAGALPCLALPCVCLHNKDGEWKIKINVHNFYIVRLAVRRPCSSGPQNIGLELLLSMLLLLLFFRLLD